MCARRESNHLQLRPVLPQLGGAGGGRDNFGLRRARSCGPGFPPRAAGATGLGSREPIGHSPARARGRDGCRPTWSPGAAWNRSGSAEPDLSEGSQRPVEHSSGSRCVAGHEHASDPAILLGRLPKLGLIVGTDRAHTTQPCATCAPATTQPRTRAGATALTSAEERACTTAPHARGRDWTASGDDAVHSARPTWSPGAVGCSRPWQTGTCPELDKGPPCTTRYYQVVPRAHVRPGATVDRVVNSSAISSAVGAPLGGA